MVYTASRRSVQVHRSKSNKGPLHAQAITAEINGIPEHYQIQLIDK